MGRKKDIEQLGVVNLVFIEIDQNDFGMAGIATTDIILVWLSCVPTCVTADDLLNSLNL